MNMKISTILRIFFSLCVLADLSLIFQIYNLVYSGLNTSNKILAVILLSFATIINSFGTKLIWDISREFKEIGE